jgi:hypothetical protein
VLARAQRVLGALAIVDVRDEHVPADDATVDVAKRPGARLKPPVRAVCAAETMLIFEGNSGRDCLCPCGDRARTIVGVNGVTGAPALQVLERPAEVLEHLAVDLLERTLGREDADQAGDCIDEQSKARFAHAEGVVDARMLLVFASGVIG